MIDYNTFKFSRIFFLYLKCPSFPLSLFPLRSSFYVVVTSPKIVINLSGNLRSYPVKEKPIGSAVSKEIQCKQTNFLLLYYKDIFIDVQGGGGSNKFGVAVGKSPPKIKKNPNKKKFCALLAHF